MVESFRLVFAPAFINMMILWIKGKDCARFREEAGFTNQIGELGYPVQEPLGGLEIYLIINIHIIRFGASLTLMYGLYFGLHYMTAGSARRTATIIAVAYSVAWTFVILVPTVASLLTV